MYAMLTRTLSFLLAALVMAAALALPAQAQSSDDARAQEIRQMLEQRDQQIKRVLGDAQSFTDAQRAQLKNLVNGVIDFEAMGRQALGPHWADLTPQQREEFVDVFAEIVRAQSLADLEPYRAEVSYQSIDVNGDEADVRTTTVYQGERIPIAYALAYAGGEWRAQDIIVDEVSTVGGYERSFQSVIRKRGFDSLMQSLRERRDEITASAQR